MRKESNFFFGFNLMEFNLEIYIPNRCDVKDEERHGVFPFTFNRIFKIAFGFGTDGFKIAVNGAYFCDFKYRAKIEKFSGIKTTENNGLILNILELDHFWLDSSLKNLENLSKN